MSLNVIGNGDVVTVGTSSYVGIINANEDTINMSDGSAETSGAVTNITVNGSGDTISTGTGDSFNINGSSDSLSMGNGSTAGTVAGNSNTINIGSSGQIDNVEGNSNNLTVGASGYVGLTSGNANTVNISNGTLNTQSNVTNTTLNGSSDTAGIASGNQVTVNGNSDILNVTTGSTVTLNASDSGDVINGVGVNVVVASGVSGITVDGFNNVVSGAGAASVTVAPAIAPLVSYFEANPNLSQDQIQAFENYSQYDSQVAQYLNTANISAIPANVLAMLDGYSSLYLALMGVPASALKEEDEIDQDFAWGSSNASVPSDSMSTMLQNLLPALLDTNATTEHDISDALECLGNAEANPTQSNIIVMDTAAKLLFEMAEQPDNAKTAPLTEPYRVSLPGLTGPYEIAVQPTLPFGDSGTNELVYIKNEDGGFWGEFWNDLNSYVVPIVDAAAAVTGNFEIILAASALDAVQAGEDFTSGQDLQGVFNVVAAVGGALNDIGTAAQQAEESAGAEVTDATSNAEVALGSYLSDGVSVAEGIDGIVNGVETGNALAILTSALGGASGIAGLGGQSTLQQFASVGASLASASQQLGSGNIVAGLASLVEAAQTSGALQSIEQGADALWVSYQAELQSIAGGITATKISLSAGIPSNLVQTFENETTGNYGLNEFDANDPNDGSEQFQTVDNLSNVASSLGLPGSDVFVAAGHGSTTAMVAPDEQTAISAAQLANTIMNDPNYTTGETVALLSCDTGSATYTGSDGKSHVATTTFAEDLANDLGANVYAPNNILWFNESTTNGVTSYSYSVSGEMTNTSGAVVANPNDPGSMVKFAPTNGVLSSP